MSGEVEDRERKIKRHRGYTKRVHEGLKDPRERDKREEEMKGTKGSVKARPFELAYRLVFPGRGGEGGGQARLKKETEREEAIGDESRSGKEVKSGHMDEQIGSEVRMRLK